MDRSPRGGLRKASAVAQKLWRDRAPRGKDFVSLVCFPPSLHSRRRCALTRQVGAASVVKNLCQSVQWTRSRPLARPSRAIGFAKFLSSPPKRLKSCQRCLRLLRFFAAKISSPNLRSVNSVCFWSKSVSVFGLNSPFLGAFQRPPNTTFCF